MKRVVGSAVLSLLVLAGPTLLGKVGVAFDGAENVAFAQPADAVTEVARQRYKEGVKAYEAGKYEDARAAFLQAYALKRVPAVLLNLGQSELRTSPPHYEDAGNHLQQFLREHTAASPEERAAAEKGIVEVKKKSGTVNVIVDTAGADIAIDGAVVGKSPLADPIFVKPGKHAVTATAAGKSANDAFDAQIGGTKSVSLTLAAAAPAVAPIPVPPMGPSPPLSPPIAPSPLPELPPGNNPPPTIEPSGGQTFMQWYSKKPLAWVTTGVAGVGLLGGVIFSIAAGAASGTTNSAGDAIRAHIAAKGQTGLQPCAQDASTGTDAPGYAAPCQILRDDVSTFHTDVAVAATGWVLFGVGGIATVAYAAADWHPHGKTSSSSSGQIRVTPVVSPGLKGLVVNGTF